MHFIGAKHLHLGLRRRGESQMQEEQMQILRPKAGLQNDGVGGEVERGEANAS